MHADKREKKSEAAKALIRLISHEFDLSSAQV
jgi:hypothetical protein